ELDAHPPAHPLSDAGMGDVSVTLPSAQAHVGPAEVSIEGGGRRIPRSHGAPPPASQNGETRIEGKAPGALRDAPPTPIPAMTPLPAPAGEASGATKR